MIPHLPDGLRSWPPQAIAALGAAGISAAVVLAGQATGQSDAAVASVGSMAVLAALFTAMGALILANLQRHTVGLLLALAGITALVEVLAVSWASWLPLAWISQWAWWPPFGLIFLALLFFPDGRLPSKRWRGLAGLLVILSVTITGALAVAALDHPRTLATALTEFTPRAQFLVRVAIIGGLLTLASGVAVLVSLWRRWRTSQGETRSQLACLLAGAVLLLIGLALDTLAVPGGWALAALALPVAMTVAVLRFRLYDLDQVVDRTLVWLVMTLLVIVGFVVLVTMLRTLTQQHDDSTASLAATGVIAVTFDPLRRRVQGTVDHLVFGDRNDPYTFMATIGGITENAGRPDDVLPSLMAAVARSLRLPYVGAELPGPHGPEIVAGHGRAEVELEAFAMMSRGEQVGRLLAAPRTRSGRFSPTERRLLENAARHAAVAAEATRLIVDLRDSRESLVVAREEERRSLRRDLHDGLGPTLAGMAMQLSAARRMVTDQERAAALLADLAGDLQQCTTEMRQVVDQLRPPALDGGLAPAIRMMCRRFAEADVVLEQDVADDLGALPAAVETAAYRILSEALTNVVRHSAATACRIAVVRDNSLRITVRDNGTGINPQARRGEGLDSMRARTSELGGIFSIGDVPGGGTEIRVMLPLPLAVRGNEVGGQKC
ncbi:sensor histidine kinase [Kineosporia babensis]|uniref:Oxygen sensor histidine kinase NreB n=1 Tax=Kineosporia babensis TaxID=499548 RepID=A0A9X1SSS2_9ACTN|nr:sensor histidine kinase [Kineosporia babensis]MCD5310616.1 sensor histidine kinase [Kineosporia babensis]